MTTTPEGEDRFVPRDPPREPAPIDRTVELLSHIADFAAVAELIVSRGPEAFRAPDDPTNRLAAKALVIDVATAVARLPDDFTVRHPDIPWQGIIGMRDRLAHDYLGTDADLLWEVLVVALPDLCEKLGLELP